ncbi:MOSC domain-containing protein [Oceanimonas doudoroffii]|uniref:MOSC domain-containing protein n=1 Tax=Oceanimonas doudoroffii TaxID=84158 RepID=A0A233RB02_9GAMM|nr:YcbX family protein [Oceanimonas doudoroffii]OXY80574.1 MOSC domain-containing protein [Oceanimonas doudoroffii]
MATITGIHHYPLKSAAGLSLEAAQVTREGLAGDRRYMLARPDGSFVTARTHPRLQLIGVRPVAGGLECWYQQHNLSVRHRLFSLQPVQTGVWGDAFIAYATHGEYDAWFSERLGEPVQLLWLGESSNRYRDKLGTSVSFADGYPLLLISKASLADLNRRAGTRLDMSRFRPNLVARGRRPFEEDGWRRIRVGEVEFLVAKPCSRCIMTTIIAGTDRFHPQQEPLATLARYRRGEDGEVYFGQNLVALNEGVIREHDEVEVLEYATAPIYPDLGQGVANTEDRGREHKAVQVRIGEHEFTGNNQHSLLTQAEQQGLTLPHSCRAGLCGRCKQTLSAGDVHQPEAPALSAAERAAGVVLACCCVPLTDVTLS